LLATLHLYGICGVSADWFGSSSTNRRQEVEIKSPNTAKNIFSDWGRQKYGGQQGSILGP